MGIVESAEQLENKVNTVVDNYQNIAKKVVEVDKLKQDIEYANDRVLELNNQISSNEKYIDRLSDQLSKKAGQILTYAEREEEVQSIIDRLNDRIAVITLESKVEEDEDVLVDEDLDNFIIDETEED